MVLDCHKFEDGRIAINCFERVSVGVLTDHDVFVEVQLFKFVLRTATWFTEDVSTLQKAG